MNEKILSEIIGINEGVSSYGLISSLLLGAAHQKSKLTPEEKAEIAERRRIFEDSRIRKAKIMENICPDCEGKLIRGKRDKKNDYKRVWTCKDCGSSHNA